MSRRFGTVWKVIEEKETWLEGEARTPKGSSGARLVPAIYIRFWREDSGTGPGTGKTQDYYYSQQDSSFRKHWEVLYDW
jgi:hypothetical protein